MDMSLYIQKALNDWNRKNTNVPYLSSILMLNKDVPLFETHFGQLDYDWILRTVRNRKCATSHPAVIRYIHDSNLSRDANYRKRDFYMCLLAIDGNIPAMRRKYASRAKYYYIMNQPKLARFYFRQAECTIKNLLYYITTFIPFARKFISTKFSVFG